MNLREFRRRMRVNRMRYPIIDLSFVFIAIHFVVVAGLATYAILTN